MNPEEPKPVITIKARVLRELIRVEALVTFVPMMLGAVLLWLVERLAAAIDWPGHALERAYRAELERIVAPIKAWRREQADREWRETCVDSGPDVPILRAAVTTGERQ